MVVCTRHPGYRKEHNKLMPLLRLKFREYPELVKLLDERHIQYNRMLDKIAYLEKRAGSMLSARTETSVQNRLSVIPPI